MHVGAGVGRNTMKSQPIRLRAQGQSRLWLTVDAKLFEDTDGYLTVEKSAWMVKCGKDATTEVLHYDFERHKDGYPEAHLQVFGTNTEFESELEAAGRRRARLHHLHLPVGGKRFRPTVEDLVEFLIDERLADPKPGSKDTLNRSRTAYRRIQLAAAIRREPDIAATTLLNLGYPFPTPTRSGAAT